SGSLFDILSRTGGSCPSHPLPGRPIGSSAPSQQRARLVERQARQSWVQFAGIAVAEVAEEIRFHVAFRKEFLLAAETGLAGGEELLVHLGIVEARHRTAIEAQRPRGETQVRALKARVPSRGSLAQLGISREHLSHAG